MVQGHFHKKHSEMDGCSSIVLIWVNRARRSDRNHNIDLPENDSAAEHFTDQQQWRQELERVLPHLKVYVKADARDWRTHLSQIETLKSSIEEVCDKFYEALHNYDFRILEFSTSTILLKIVSFTTINIGI